MSGDEEIILDDDAPEIVKTEELPAEAEAPEGEEPAEEQSTLGKTEIETSEGIEVLKKMLEAEQRARQEAERRAHEASVRARASNAETQETNYQLILSAISRVEQHSAALRAAYVEAMSAYDYDKAAQIQEEVIHNANTHAELQRGRKVMEEAAKRQPVQPVAPPHDPIEMWAAQVTPRSANWLRSHKASLNTEAMQKRVILAHGLAHDEGIEPDSDAYFDFVERQIGLKKAPAPRQVEEEPDADSPLSAASTPTPRRSAPPPAAPVSRGAPRPNAARLSPAEREAARVSGVTEEEYARNKERIRNGARS